MASGNKGERGRRSRPVAEVLERRQLLATITVNSAGDADGADGSNTLSLRQAIEIANGTLPIVSLTAAQQGLVVGPLASPNTIDFAIPGTGPFTISPSSALPAITSPVVIDGYSQPGAHPNTNGPRQADNAALEIDLNGTQAGAVGSGLVIQAGNSTVEGLAIGGYGAFPNPNASAIRLDRSNGDLIEGNFIGVDSTGIKGVPDGQGVEIDGGDSNTIGGTTPDARNIISGNGSNIIFDDVDSDNNQVEGNFVGTDVTGTVAVPFNFESGIYLVVGSSNTIGGTVAGAGNLISGNEDSGLMVLGSGNLVEGNFVGTDLTGTRPLPNNVNGLEIEGSSDTIGGTTAGAGNVISGNGGSGLSLLMGTGSLLEGNYIGTDITGTEAIPNNGGGIGLSGSNSNTIGGTVAGAANVISGNQGDGIDIGPFIIPVHFGTIIEPSQDNVLEGNFIGTGPHGTVVLPNSGDGISITAGTDNTIGGTAAGAGNVIAFSGKSGVSVSTSESDSFNNTGNRISGNSIYANGGLGIDLGDDGVTPNTPSGDPTGPNRLQPYPVLTSATSTTTGAAVSATLDALPSTSYDVEFFANPAADPSGFGQGQTYLGSTVATTDASGHASFSFATTASLGGQFLSATATDPQGDTSEFARDLQVIGTTTTLTLEPPASPVIGQPLTLLAAVAPAQGAVSPTGQVVFIEDGQAIGTATLDATGSASLTIPAPAGPHAFAAIFAGSAGNPGSSSDEVFVTAVKQATTTSLVGPNKIATLGVPTTFTAVVGASVGGVPGGQVNFLEDGVVIGSAPLDASGVAVFITDQLLPGPHTITAAYVGDSTHAPSQSNAIAVGVFAPLAFGGPSVTSDVFAGPRSVTITFNRGLLLAPAQDKANYTIVGPGHRVITVESAVYGPSGATVTLTTLQKLNPRQSYQLTINGVRGDRVVDVFGIPLNGQKKGRPGHNYVGKITVKKVPVVKVVHPSGPKPKAHPTAHTKGH